MTGTCERIQAASTSSGPSMRLPELVIALGYVVASYGANLLC
jgi:hypothetical protein